MFAKTKNRVFVFDVAPEMNEDAENFYGTDEKLDIHPTKHGHATLARVFTRKIQRAFKGLSGSVFGSRKFNI